ncbi:hypothetical protein DPX16_22334 [Anabarilius grahami]|uniref:Uncharacterized protein n=1 Tax=Anabarilius grahami TaxID=495550 RepID=A0A3N0YRI3_ANAGA|nr:hypothetical protein DPX16_22334 [Anabarilius grahami]
MDSTGLCLGHGHYGFTVGSDDSCRGDTVLKGSLARRWLKKAQERVKPLVREPLQGVIYGEAEGRGQDAGSNVVLKEKDSEEMGFPLPYKAGYPHTKQA